MNRTQFWEAAVLSATILGVTLSACTAFSMAGEELARTFGGTESLFRTYEKTVLERAQADISAAVFTGEEVELFRLDIPNDTKTRVTGEDDVARYALAYRSSLTIHGTEVLSDTEGK
ncbi:hypothetical protein EDF62_3342 [Leucobacter luti]|uniref:Uncharacterized protein n=1 Tax=Leucobacter luti TaxID=340320 RepID=A0A4R6RRV0_9MICO|nr:hypothetical protein [Leucobacter luti]TDP89589.1 hypothetical protein EDF62_3342 [Leucobacter luti]